MQCTFPPEADLVDVGGVGGTLAATRCRLPPCERRSAVLTDTNFEHMIHPCPRFREGCGRNYWRNTTCRGRLSN